MDEINKFSFIIEQTQHTSNRKAVKGATFIVNDSIFECCCMEG